MDRFEKYQLETFGADGSATYGAWERFRDMVVETVDFQPRSKAYYRFAVDNPSDKQHVSSTR